MAEDELLGAAVYALLSDPVAWIYRRVESFDVLDDDHVRRSVSIDLEVPDNEDLPALPFLPLTMLRKRPLKNFDLRNSEGLPVPALNRRQNGAVATSALAAAARGLLREAEYELPGEIESSLRVVATGRPGEAQREYNGWRNRAESGPVMNEWAALVGSESFMRFAEVLISDFILLAVTETKPGTRTIFKISYDEPFKADEGLNWVQRRAVQLGWRHKTIRVDVPAATAAQSFHFEMAAPEDLEIERAVFRFEPIVRETKDLPPIPDEALISDGPHVQRAHLYAPDIDPRYAASAFVYLQARPGGLLLESFIVCAAAFLLLLGGRIELDGFVAAQGTATTLLVLVPGFLGAYIVRPGEHVLVSTMLAGIRLVTLIAAGASVFAAFLLAADVSGGALCVWWTGLVVTAGACLGILAVSNWRRWTTSRGG